MSRLTELKSTVRREALPCRRARHSKVSPTDHSPCRWQDECLTVCQPQPPPADDGRNGRSCTVSPSLNSKPYVYLITVHLTAVCLLFKLPARNMTLQFLTVYADPVCHNAECYRQCQTDRWIDNSMLPRANPIASSSAIG